MAAAGSVPKGLERNDHLDGPAPVESTGFASQTAFQSRFALRSSTNASSSMPPIALTTNTTPFRLS